MACEKGKAKPEPDIPSHNYGSNVCKKWEAKSEPDTISYSAGARSCEQGKAKLEPDIPGHNSGISECEKREAKLESDMIKYRPVLRRTPEEVTHEEYAFLCRAVSADGRDHVAARHSAVEGPLEVRALLFVSAQAPAVVRNNIQNYARRVFNIDEDAELLPKWLNVAVGAVDSEDLPLVIACDPKLKTHVLTVFIRQLFRECRAMFEEAAEKDGNCKLLFEAVCV